MSTIVTTSAHPCELGLGSSFTTLDDFHRAVHSKLDHVKTLQHIVDTRMILGCATHGKDPLIGERPSGEEEVGEDGESCPFVVRAELTNQPSTSETKTFSITTFQSIHRHHSPSASLSHQTPPPSSHSSPLLVSHTLPAPPISVFTPQSKPYVITPPPFANIPYHPHFPMSASVPEWYRKHKKRVIRTRPPTVEGEELWLTPEYQLWRERLGMGNDERPLKGWCGDHVGWYARGNNDETEGGSEATREEEKGAEFAPPPPPKRRRRKVTAVAPTRFSSRSCTKPRPDSTSSATITLTQKFVEPLSVVARKGDPVSRSTNPPSKTAKSNTSSFQPTLVPPPIIPTFFPASKFVSSPVSSNKAPLFAVTPKDATSDSKVEWKAQSDGNRQDSTTKNVDAQEDSATRVALDALLELAVGGVEGGASAGPSEGQANLLGLEIEVPRFDDCSPSQSAQPPRSSSLREILTSFLSPRLQPSPDLEPPEPIPITASNTIISPPFSHFSPPPPSKTSSSSSTRIQFPDTPPFDFPLPNHGLHENRSVEASGERGRDPEKLIISRVLFGRNVVESAKRTELGRNFDADCPLIEDTIDVDSAHETIQTGFIPGEAGDSTLLPSKSTRNEDFPNPPNATPSSLPPRPTPAPVSSDALKFFPRKKKSKGSRKGLHSWVASSTSNAPRPSSATPPSSPHMAPINKPLPVPFISLSVNRSLSLPIPNKLLSNPASTSNSHSSTTPHPTVLESRATFHRLRKRLFPPPSGPKKNIPRLNAMYYKPEPLYSVSNLERNLTRLYSVGIDATSLRSGSINFALLELCQLRPDPSTAHCSALEYASQSDALRAIKSEGEETATKERDAWKDSACRYLLRRNLSEWELGVVEKEDPDLWVLVEMLAGVAWINSTARRTFDLRDGPLLGDRGGITGDSGKGLMRFGERVTG